VVMFEPSCDRQRVGGGLSGLLGGGPLGLRVGGLMDQEGQRVGASPVGQWMVVWWGGGLVDQWTAVWQACMVAAQRACGMEARWTCRMEAWWSCGPASLCGRGLAGLWGKILVGQWPGLRQLAGPQCGGPGGRDLAVLSINCGMEKPSTR
jgi:hypothetical protein